MRKRTRKIVRAVMVGIFASLPFVMAPCESALQYPTPDTQTYWGVALDLP